MHLPRTRPLVALAAALALLASGCATPDSAASTPTAGSASASSASAPDVTGPGTTTPGATAGGEAASSAAAESAAPDAAEAVAPSPQTPESSPTEPAAAPAPSQPASPSDAAAPDPASTSSAGEAAPARAAASGSAADALERLEVKGRAPKSGYSRAEFGPAWTDTDHNGCDTRNDILARDLVEEAFKPGTRDCVVLTGVLQDPYTGTEIHFVRGQDTSEAVQIDHVVALSDAWQKGAQQLSEAERTALANDPLNLLAVDGPSNQGKSDADAASWLPPQRSYRCAYVARQIAVKSTYTLWVTDAEKDAMARVLESCPGQSLPDGGAAPRTHGDGDDRPAAPAPAPVPAPVEREPEPKAVPTTAARPEPAAPEVTGPKEATEQSATDPRFSSCKKAKAAGYGPYVKGTDPEYHWYRDGDGDGIDCE